MGRLITLGVFLLFVYLVFTQLIIPLLKGTPLFPSLRGSEFRKRYRQAQRYIEDAEQAELTLEKEREALSKLRSLPDEEMKSIQAE